MTEDQSVEPVVETVVAETPAPAEKPGLLGQTPSMWFLIESAVVLLIVVIMRVAA